MKKTILSLSVALSAFMASADTITNYVYVISNQYFRQVREITNRVSTVTYKTNVTVRVDVSDAAIARAEYEADRAERAVSNATSIAEAAASSASDAASSASAAYSSERSAQSAVSDGLQRINERINWFDQHSGETITQVTTNFYFAEDSTARAAAALNANEISSLELTVSGHTTSIGQLGTRIGTAESTISGHTTSIGQLGTRIGTAESTISGHTTSIGQLGTRISTAESTIGEITNSINDLSTRIGTAESTISGHTTSIGQLGTRIGNVESAIEFVSNKVNELSKAIDKPPYTYTSPAGTSYTNINIYPNENDQGKVSVESYKGFGNNFNASTVYRFYPEYGGNANSAFWTFSPAFVEFDSEGLKIHYVANERRTITAATYNAGYQYVPYDFYWQNGTIYIVIDSYNGSTWSGRIITKYSGAGQQTYPNSLYGSLSDTDASRYFNTTFHSRSGTIMGTSTSFTVGHLKTAKGSYLSGYSDLLWIPANPSPIQQATLAWIAGFGTPSN